MEYVRKFCTEAKKCTLKVYRKHKKCALKVCYRYKKCALFMR